MENLGILGLSEIRYSYKEFERIKQHVPRASGRKEIPQESSHLVYVKTTSLKLIVSRP